MTDDQIDAAPGREFPAMVARSRRFVRRELQKIADALAMGHTRDPKKRERRLLNSFAFKLVAANRARVRLALLERLAALKNGKPIVGRRFGPSAHQTLTVAGRINLWHPTPERVGVMASPKQDGSLRTLNMFGLDHRTRQEMVRMVVANRAVLHPAQCAIRTGLLQTQQAVRDALATGEYNVAAYIDIRDCFGSVNVAALSDLLALPEQIIQANVGFAHLNVDARQAAKVRKEVEKNQTHTFENDKCDHTRDHSSCGASRCHSSHNPRGGIPAGSSCSPLIAEIAIAQCLQDAPSGVALFVWVDDILILAKNEEEARRAGKTLRAAFAATPVGNFVLKTTEYTPVANGVDYIGSTFQLTAEGATVAPTASNQRMLDEMMAGHLHRLSQKGERRSEAEAALKGWISANRLWSEADRWERHYRSEIDRAELQHEWFFRGRFASARAESRRGLRATGSLFPAPRRRRLQIPSSSALPHSLRQSYWS